MSDHSTIEWTDASWNPVTGCNKVSPGCKHCYAETFAERFRGVPGHPYEQGFDLRLWPDRLTLPLHWKAPRRIFVNSMSDLFHDRIPFEYIDLVFDTMRSAHWHQFQVLTTRPERMVSYLDDRCRGRAPFDSAAPHIWLGTSIESQQYINRAGLLAEVPSRVRFLSLEPLLGELDLSGLLGADRINWVIVGGESGHGARPMAEDWVRVIRAQCLEASVPFFFKQWGGRQKKRAGRLLDGRTWDEVPRSV